MSAYTTIAAVKATMPGDAPLTEITTPRISDAVNWIASASAQVDVALVAGGQTLPITDTALLALLDIRVAREVAYQVLTTRGAWAPNASPPFWTKWHDEFEAMLETMSNPEQASIVPSNITLPYSFTMNADPDADDPYGINARITRTKKF